jgi:hypothetical protein
MRAPSRCSSRYDITAQTLLHPSVWKPGKVYVSDTHGSIGNRPCLGNAYLSISRYAMTERQKCPESDPRHHTIDVSEVP